MARLGWVLRGKHSAFLPRKITAVDFNRRPDGSGGKTIDPQNPGAAAHEQRRGGQGKFLGQDQDTFQMFINLELRQCMEVDSAGANIARLCVVDLLGSRSLYSDRHLEGEACQGTPFRVSQLHD